MSNISVDEIYPSKIEGDIKELLSDIRDLSDAELQILGGSGYKRKGGYGGGDDDDGGYGGGDDDDGGYGHGKGYGYGYGYGKGHDDDD